MIHQNMLVSLAGESVPFCTNGMVAMRPFITAGNSVRAAKGISTFNAAQYLQSNDIDDFISAIIKKYGGKKEDYLRVEGRGKSAVTLADIRVALKVAMRMDADFELEVIDAFIGLSEWRLQGGDEFKMLNDCIDKNLPDRIGKDNRGCYINAAKLIRSKCGIEKPSNGETWNQETTNRLKQKLRYDMEHRLVSMLQLGLIRDWEHLKEVIEKL